MIFCKPLDEIPELEPSTEGNGNSRDASPTHQEQQAEQMDSAVPWTQVGDGQLPGWTTKNTFLERESECGAGSPRKWASVQGCHDFAVHPFAEPKPKEQKKTHPDLQSRTEKQCIKKRWEDALHTGHKDWANVQPVLNQAPAAGKVWKEEAEDCLGQSVSLGRQDHSTAKGVCCYCLKSCIHTVADKWHGAVEVLLHQYGLETVLGMDWNNVTTLPKELRHEIFEEMPETCPHFNLQCPSHKCPAGTTQCHHHLHGTCRRLHCLAFCHCAVPLAHKARRSRTRAAGLGLESQCSMSKKDVWQGTWQNTWQGRQRRWQGRWQSSWQGTW